jgi:soluble lytic murein transglycosylase
MKKLIVFGALLGVLLTAGAAAWLTLPHWYHPWMPEPVGRAAFPLKHVDEVGAAAVRHRLSPALVAAVIYVESGFDADVRSDSGAVGLMQVMPQTADEIAAQTDGFRFRRDDLAEPAVNVRYGCYYLRRLVDRYDGSLVCALAAYNAGAAHVDEWLAGRGALAVGGIPFPETREYVRRVLRCRDIYADLYGPLLAGVPVDRGVGGG